MTIGGKKIACATARSASACFRAATVTERLSRFFPNSEEFADANDLPRSENHSARGDRLANQLFPVVVLPGKPFARASCPAWCQLRSRALAAFGGRRIVASTRARCGFPNAVKIIAHPPIPQNVGKNRDNRLRYRSRAGKPRSERAVAQAIFFPPIVIRSYSLVDAHYRSVAISAVPQRRPRGSIVLPSNALERDAVVKRSIERMVWQREKGNSRSPGQIRHGRVVDDRKIPLELTDEDEIGFPRIFAARRHEEHAARAFLFRGRNKRASRQSAKKMRKPIPSRGLPTAMARYIIMMWRTTARVTFNC